MIEKPIRLENHVEAFPEVTRRTFVSDELNRITGLLREAFPDVRQLTFEFDGQLWVNIDLRSNERLSVIEERLPYLGGGKLFSQLRRGKSPNRPFDHRISALVAR